MKAERERYREGERGEKDTMSIEKIRRMTKNGILYENCEIILIKTN